MHTYIVLSYDLHLISRPCGGSAFPLYRWDAKLESDDDDDDDVDDNGMTSLRGEARGQIKTERVADPVGGMGGSITVDYTIGE